MALNQKEIEAMVGELETRLERLRQLYDQYFLGYEKLEPSVARKDVERRVETLRREQIRNTALRFRFTVLTQKLSTYQTLWHRTCRQIEEGTFKRHLQKAAKRFGPNAGKKGADVELDIDVDLGELESEVAADMEALSDDGRRAARGVDAEAAGGDLAQDTVRPARPPVELDDDDDDMPTNRPPGGEGIDDVSIPKSPGVPSMDARSHSAAPFANTRPNIRKTDPGAPRGASVRPVRRSTPPPFNPQAPVMPKVASAPPPAPAPAHPASASKIALPIPGTHRHVPESASMRAAPPATGSSLDLDGRRASGQMRAALPVPGTTARGAPPGSNTRLPIPGTTARDTSPGSTSSMRAAQPVGPTSTSMRAAQQTGPIGSPSTSMRAAQGLGPGGPGGPAGGSLRLPPPGTTARAGLPLPGGTRSGEMKAPTRTGDLPGRATGDVTVAQKTGDLPPMRSRAPSVGASKPPPPLPSAIAGRKSLADLASDVDKDKK